MPNKQEEFKNEEIPSFVKEVAKYFMNFLETDFKKRRLPKRNSIQKNKNGLKVGLELEKYSKLKKTLLTIFNDGFKKNNIKIKKGEYEKNIPEGFLSFIENKIKTSLEENFEKIFNNMENLIKEKKDLYANEYDKFLEETKKETQNIFLETLIDPLLNIIDKPLKNLDITDNNKYQLKNDLIDSIFFIFEDKYTESLQHFFQKKERFNLKENLQEIIKLSEVRNELIRFFKAFSISDAFFDIYQIYKNSNIIDKTEIYLYFYELSLNNDSFPIFYTPIIVEKEENSFIFKFENRLFINTKAIDFVVQEFNLKTENKSTLVGEFDRILYTNEEIDFSSVLKNYIEEIENFFGFNTNINFENLDFQKVKNLSVSFSNKSYLFLFDKSDEALINDYEEILNNDGEIIKNFSTLLNGFIEKNPKAFMQQIDDEWSEKNISKKLILESPIPLNDEQKKVLMVLQKPDCNFIILEGPPGTGKSHTITAIICEALLKEKSVLVLSDKKEALDIVEDKISSTLNKIRYENDFQNPILRLGKAGNKFYKIVSPQTIQKIKEHYDAYRQNESEININRENLLLELEQNIKKNIEHYKGIDINDIILYLKNNRKFSSIHWLTSLDENKIDLMKIKKGLERIHKYNNIEWNINKELLNDVNYKFLTEYKNSLNTLNESKENFKKENININTNSLIENLNKHGSYNKSTLQTLKSIQKIITKLDNLYKKKFKNLDLFKPLEELDIGILENRLEVVSTSLNLFSESKKFLGDQFVYYEIFSNFEIPKDKNLQEAMLQFKNYINDLNTIKKPVIGFLFMNNKIEECTRSFKKTYNYFNIEKPQKYFKEIQKIYDLFNFIYKKISNKYKTKENKNTLAHSTLKILIDLLNNNNDKNHTTDYKKIKKLQKKLVKKKNSIEIEEPSLTKINDLKSIIKEINWNIESFKKIDEIVNVFNKLENVIPDKIKIDNKNYNTFFDNNIKISLEETIKTVEKLKTFENDIGYILDIKEKYPVFSENIKLNISRKNINKTSSILSNYSDEEIKAFLDYKTLQSKLQKKFNSQPKDKFLNLINNIEELTTAEMTYFLDKRIIEYTQNHANDVNTLRNILAKKQKFPKELFQNLKKAFPCILAGIRDYAEFIPLEKGLFDLIIIDEASQVSIAQALPALIRGKQVIILGDDKQFSNVKANNASKVTNQELKKRVTEAFKKERHIEFDKNGWLTKVKENFDIKNSILRFSKFIRNYECQLRKHFRCYPEIISYSDKYFYNNSLQCMKIRGKKIEDVIKINIIEHDGILDIRKNTNKLEANYIIKKLQEFKENGTKQSIGIITPHREQAHFLFDKINELADRNWFFEECKLKIMTFDTCQGEERDYIFYSMVATKEKDQLKWIFIKNFASIDDETDGTIKSQRLNVGFSRAKECIHFVLSKPIEEFQGEIRNALLHYKNELKNGNRIPIEELDSEMEYKIREIFLNTQFYKENKEKIEFIPQFELGKYLKQLNKDYKHPNYKVDFLLIFNDLKIIIEYDGFKEHFINRGEVNELNYEYYMKEDDIYRQKILEGYGYKFLRINRFNIGKDPVKTLNNRLQEIIKKNRKYNNS